MSNTVRENILRQLETTLGTISGLDVYRSRLTALDRTESPAVILFWTSNVPVAQTIPRITWQLTARVVLVFRSDEPDKDADAMIRDIHAAITSDLSLGGLAQDVAPAGQTLQLENSDLLAANVIMDFNILYTTALKDLTGV